MIDLILSVFLMSGIETDASVSPGGERPGVVVEATRKKPGKNGTKSTNKNKKNKVSWTKAPPKKKPLFTEWSASNNPYDRPRAQPPRTPAVRTPVRRPPTGDQVLRAIRELPFRSFRVQSQPVGETLVNFDTVLFTVPRDYSATVTLLGYRVQVEGTPVRYRWVHGDGTTQVTTNPGRKHPNHTVTHRFVRDGNLRMRVDTIYSVRYRINGGSWQRLSSTITATGPNVPIRVHEATALLTRE